MDLAQNNALRGTHHTAPRRLAQVVRDTAAVPTPAAEAEEGRSVSGARDGEEDRCRGAESAFAEAVLEGDVWAGGGREGAGGFREGVGAGVVGVGGPGFEGE